MNEKPAKKAWFSYPLDSGPISRNKAKKGNIRIAEHERNRGPVAFGDLEGLAKFYGFLYGKDEESAEACTQSEGLGHEYHLHCTKACIHIGKG